MPRKRDLTDYTQFGNVLFNLEKLDGLKDPKPDANGCITWREGEGGRHRQGYLMMGGIRIDSNERFMTVAHRVEAMRKFKRELFHDDFVIHTCSNVKCLNPDHLILGDYRTQRKVMKDNGRTGNIGRAPKVAGVEYKQNRKYKYTEEEILWMRSAPCQDIAAKYNISNTRASRLKHGMKIGYKWLKDPK